MKPKFFYFCLIVQLSLFCLINSQAINQEDSSTDIERYLLTSQWTFKQYKNESMDWLPAKVPGTVHTDLWANKIIEDPYYGSNEAQYQWIEEKDWIYRSKFNISSYFLNRSHINLVFYGLDTHADVKLNGKIILSVDNMFRKWSVDVKNLLKENDNELEILFNSSVAFDNAKNALFYLPADNSRIWSRKAAYHYGWDWGPRFVTCGVWQPIYIESFDNGFIDGIKISPKILKDELAILAVDVDVYSANDDEFDVSVYDMNQNDKVAKKSAKVKAGNTTITVMYEIKNPKLWWPNGFGEQALYNISIIVSKRNQIIDKKIQETGLRTVEVIQEKDLNNLNDGQSFYFRVNGVNMFMKGANYIPPSMFMPSVTHENYTHLIKTSKDSNFNMLRLWGGGNFENDEFYTLCDRYGIMIWHDFMFAGGMYPGNDEYSENIKQEHIYQIRRLRNHPSIAMWCGGNEIKEGWFNWGWSGTSNSETVWKWYLRIFEEIIPQVIDEYDGTRFYWSSSPSYGWGNQQSYKEGDSHYWGVWHGMSPFESLNTQVGRFISEYGMEGGIDYNTIKKFTAPEDRWINGSSTSQVMRTHQKHRSGYQNLLGYLNMYYKDVHTFDNYLYITQLVQAFGIQVGIESHRRNMPRTMGTLYWQLNDVWPVFSWSSMDYYGKWKALQWRAKKYYQNTIMSIIENNENILIYVISDVLDSFTGLLQLKVVDFQGNVTWSTKKGVFIKQGSKLVFKVNRDSIKGANSTINDRFLHARLILNADIEQPTEFEHFYYFMKPKDLLLTKPKIQIKSINTNEISVRSDVLAKDVYLFVDDSIDQVKFSDNFFDIYPGKERIIAYESMNQNENMISHIKVYNVYDSFTDQSQGGRVLELGYTSNTPQFVLNNDFF